MTVVIISACGRFHNNDNNTAAPVEKSRVNVVLSEIATHSSTTSHAPRNKKRSGVIK
jgi:hypothetical protein